MDKKLNELKKKAQDDYENKLREIEVEYQKNLEAIDRVAALMEIDKTQSSPSEEQPQPQPQKKMMATSQTIREIVNRFDNEFSVTDIREEAAKMSPPLDVSKNVLHSVIKQKREKNELITIQEGVGRTPAIYKNAKHETSHKDTLFDSV